MQSILTPNNWKRFGKPRVMLNGQDVTNRAHVAFEGERGYVVLHKLKSPAVPGKPKHYVIEETDGIRHAAREMVTGKVEFIR